MWSIINIIEIFVHGTCHLLNLSNIYVYYLWSYIILQHIYTANWPLNKSPYNYTNIVYTIYIYIQESAPLDFLALKTLRPIETSPSPNPASLNHSRKRQSRARHYWIDTSSARHPTRQGRWAGPEPIVTGVEWHGGRYKWPKKKVSQGLKAYLWGPR